MKTFFYKFYENIIDSFRGENFIYHIIAVVSTYLIVAMGLDWKYFQFFAGSSLANILFSAAIFGFLLPVLVPAILLIVGKIKKNAKILNTGFALGQAAIVGLFVSYFYKFFAGRIAPPLNHLNNTFLDINKLSHISSSLIDTSRIFNFGLGRNGIFWGWPSSHTTVAFAMAFALITIYPKNKIIKIFAILYALYIGIGVSMTIHWFSDFVAGAFLGTVVGIVVGKAFKERIS